MQSIAQQLRHSVSGCVCVAAQHLFAHASVLSCYSAVSLMRSPLTAFTLMRVQKHQSPHHRRSFRLNCLKEFAEGEANVAGQLHVLGLIGKCVVDLMRLSSRLIEELDAVSCTLRARRKRASTLPAHRRCHCMLTAPVRCIAPHAHCRRAPTSLPCCHPSVTLCTSSLLHSGAIVADVAWPPRVSPLAYRPAVVLRPCCTVKAVERDDLADDALVEVTAVAELDFDADGTVSTKRREARGVRVLHVSLLLVEYLTIDARCSCAPTSHRL